MRLRLETPHIPGKIDVIYFRLDALGKLGYCRLQESYDC